MQTAKGMRPGAPPTIKELVAQAENYNFNINVPLKHWIRSAETLYQEAAFALSDGDYGRAYVMLYRHSMLVINSLRTHPEFKDPEGRKSVKPLLDRIDRIIKDLEDLKPEIEGQRKEWERMTAQQPTNQKQTVSDTSATSYEDHARRDPTLRGNAQILDASENQDLAVDLAREELSRRDTLRRSSRQPFPSTIDDAELQRQIEATRNTLDRAQRGAYDDDGRTTAPIHSQYNYPSVMKSAPVSLDQHPALQPALPPSRPPKAGYEGRPMLPPKQYPQQPSIQSAAVPSHYATHAMDRPLLPPKDLMAAAPAVPKKQRLTFKPGAYLENGDPIRSLFIPSKLRKSFLEIAAKNTAAGLEMCGILCGSPVNNALFVRCLLIPDQKCTSDTVETENESTMAEYCIEEDLMILGWIHTHPTQTCFMSSRDLHTHAGYQVMMPESVAIVCAPKYTPSYGIFRLTSPPGLGHILDCKQTATFHPHSVTNLYCEAEHPSGHVYESDKLPFYVHDLRSK